MYKYLIFLILAILEYSIVNLFGKNVKNFEKLSLNYQTFRFSDIEGKTCGLNILIRVFFPTIYIIIIAGICYKLDMDIFIENLYIISILFYICRWISIKFIMSRSYLLNWKHELVVSGLGSLISIFIYYQFILKTRNIFIPLEDLKNEIWIVIIFFIVVIIRDSIFSNITTDKVYSTERKEKYIYEKYQYFKEKYNDILENENNKELVQLIYSIMIYENYNRPFFYRIFEYVKLYFTGKATLGVMQVSSRVAISDRTSVRKAYRFIKRLYNKYKITEADEFTIYENILNEYNLGQEYNEEVRYIFNSIKNIDIIEKRNQYILSYQRDTSMMDKVLKIKFSTGWKHVGILNKEEICFLSNVQSFYYNEETTIKDLFIFLTQKLSNAYIVRLEIPIEKLNSNMELKTLYRIMHKDKCIYIFDTKMKIKSLLNLVDDDGVLEIALMIAMEIGGVLWNVKGIKFELHSKEKGKHHLPHIHAKSEGSEVVVDLNGNVLEGELKPKKQKYVIQKVKDNKESLMLKWNDMTDGQKFKIANNEFVRIDYMN